MIIDLPFPSKDLSPNARVHWTVKARAVKRHREWAQWASCSYGPVEAENLNVTIIFYPPSKRHFDDDNLLSRCKPLIDGVSDSLEVDDSKWKISIRRGEVMKGGNVRFEIEVPA